MLKHPKSCELIANLECCFVCLGVSFSVSDFRICRSLPEVIAHASASKKVPKAMDDVLLASHGVGVAVFDQRFGRFSLFQFLRVEFLTVSLQECLAWLVFDKDFQLTAASGIAFFRLAQSFLEIFPALSTEVNSTELLMAPPPRNTSWPEWLTPEQQLAPHLRGWRPLHSLLFDLCVGLSCFIWKFDEPGD